MTIEGGASGAPAPRLRYAMVGGGPGAFIGDVHRKAIALDGRAALVAGCFSTDFEKTRATGALLDLPGDRLYRSAAELVAGESAREDRPDFLVVATPNAGHFPAARAALEAGWALVCEKPLTTNRRDAEVLAALAKARNVPVCVAYAYSMYPLVKHLRDLIAGGELGEIRFVHGEYPQEWLAVPLETSGQKQAAWRTDPAQAGASNCVGDIGSHVEHLVAHLTGLPIARLCARLDRMGPGRALDDNATVLVDYAGGARGVYWSSQVAIGHDNGLRVRIYGTRGSVEWAQETPNVARIAHLDRPRAELARGRDPMTARAQSMSRLPSGHPEGYFEAFANMYSAFVADLARRRAGAAPGRDDVDYPGVEDGVRGVRFIEACVESSARGAAWVPV